LYGIANRNITELYAIKRSELNQSTKAEFDLPCLDITNAIMSSGTATTRITKAVPLAEPTITGRPLRASGTKKLIPEAIADTITTAHDNAYVSNEFLEIVRLVNCPSTILPIQTSITSIYL
jgi:hypothetical protein